jgi:hypothetical protein
MSRSDVELAQFADKLRGLPKGKVVWVIRAGAVAQAGFRDVVTTGGHTSVFASVPLGSSMMSPVALDDVHLSEEEAHAALAARP